MGFFRWLFRLGPRIPAHTLGIHDLSGGAADALMAADRAALAPLFRRVSESSDAPPRSTLLLVYCTIGADGGIVNSPRTLREIIRDAGAPVVIVASPNPRRSYGLAVKRQPRLARANLVLTLDRRGTAFGVFVRGLVTEMKKGTAMPRAWRKLAPREPMGEPGARPATLIACELGKLAFR
jgi:hypothetical protein